ncbi:MAG: F0F1 ATP synthase subunit delta, partial [Candidatus Omnitrophota bacterium]
ASLRLAILKYEKRATRYEKMPIQLLIIQVGFFAVLILALRIMFHRNLNSALERLKQLQKEAMVKEAHLKEELERAKQERLGEVAKGKQKARELVEEAKKDALDARSAIEEQAKENKQRIVAQGKQELEKMREDLLSTVKDKAMDISQEVIGDIFSPKGNQALQQALVREIIDELKGLDKQKFSAKDNNIEISCSYPLAPQEKSSLKDILSEKLGLDVVITGRTDPGLIAGIVIRIGEFVIDGSLRNKLSKAIEYIKDK